VRGIVGCYGLQTLQFEDDISKENNLCVEYFK